MMLKKKARMQLYEGMYIVKTILSEEAQKKAVERITSFIEKNGGEVHKIHDQGKKKLAYEIEGHRQGHYFLIYFTLGTHLMQEMWRENHLNEDLLRFMTLKADDVQETIEFKPLKV